MESDRRAQDDSQVEVNGAGITEPQHLAVGLLLLGGDADRVEQALRGASRFEGAMTWAA
jgi:hypothetical protein